MNYFVYFMPCILDKLCLKILIAANIVCCEPTEMDKNIVLHKAKLFILTSIVNQPLHPFIEMCLLVNQLLFGPWLILQIMLKDSNSMSQ
jgi:hypothetical protein